MTWHAPCHRVNGVLDLNAPLGQQVGEGAGDRFIALHMIDGRIRPDAPTSEPAMINTLLPSANPAAAPASPEYEFISATTTGMSAPPIGVTVVMPRTDATPHSSQNGSGLAGS